MAIELKLKYCPECGSHVKLSYNYGVVYKYITFYCTRPTCPMASKASFLSNYNERYKPNLTALIIEAYRRIVWWARLQRARKPITKTLMKRDIKKLLRKV